MRGIFEAERGVLAVVCPLVFGFIGVGWQILGPNNTGEGRFRGFWGEDSILTVIKIKTKYVFEVVDVHWFEPGTSERVARVMGGWNLLFRAP